MSSSTRRKRRKEIGNSNQIQRFVQNVRFYPRVRKGNTLQNLYNVLLWKAYIEEAEHLRYNDEIKQIYAKRKETIERVFADAKEKQGMRWTTLRGLKNKSMQAMLTFAVMNVKNWPPAFRGAKRVDGSGRRLTPGE